MSAENDNSKFLSEQGYEFLTDWTFTDIFPLQSLLREGKELLRSYEKRGYTKFNLNFTQNQHLDLWGKKENDYEI